MKRIATVFAPKDLGAAGTEVIDLNLSEQISRIALLWRCTNVTVSVMTAPVASCISKIELVDGSDVLFSLSGQQAQALNFYDRKVMPHNAIGLTVGNYFEAEFAIDFGRFLWDADLALRPEQFRNLQLKVTWDEDACNGSVEVNSFQVYAYVDDAPARNAIGFLMAKNLYTYDMLASSHEYIDLPTDYPIRKLLLQVDQDGHDPIDLLDNLKVGVDNDKHVLIDIAAAWYARMLNSEYPRIVEQATLDAVVTAKTIYANVSHDQVLVIQQDDTAVTANGEIQAVTWTGHKAALSTGVAVQSDFAEISGRVPHNCIPIDFGPAEDMEQFLQAQAFNSIRADILTTATAATGDTGRLAAQQLRRY